MMPNMEQDESYGTDCPSSWPIHHLVTDIKGITKEMEERAMANAILWLHQAARGEIPHGVDNG